MEDAGAKDPVEMADGEEAGANDSASSIMSRGGRHSDTHRLDAFLRDDADRNQQALSAEQYETEEEGAGARATTR